MLVKFERYLTPSSRMANIPRPINIKGDVLLNSYNSQSNGFVQRLNVQPDEILTSRNKDRVGFSTKAEEIIVW